MKRFEEDPYLGITSTTIATLIYQAGGFFTYLLIFTFLPPNQSGLYFLIYAFYGLIGVFTSVGFGEVISRYVPFYAGKKENIKASSVLYTSLALNLGLLVFALFLISRVDFVSLYNDELSQAITPAVLFFGLTMLMQNVLIYSMLGIEQYLKQAFLNAFQGLMKPIATYVALSAGMGIDGIFLMQGILFLIIDMLTLAFILGTLKPMFTAIEKVGEIIKFGLFSGLNTLISYVLGWMDIVMLGFFTSTNVVAVYGFSVLVTRNVIPFVSMVMGNIALPVFSRKEGKGDNIYSYSRPLYVLSLYFSSFFFFVALIAAPFFIYLFFPQYEESNIYMPLLGLGMVASAAANPLKSFLFAKTKSDVVAKAAVIAAGSNLLMNVGLIPLIGAIGACIATMISMSLYLVYLVLDMRRRNIEVVDWRTYFIFGFLLVASALFLYDYYSEVEIESVLIHMGSLAIVLTFYIYMTMQKDEFEFIKAAIRKVSTATGISMLSYE